MDRTTKEELKHTYDHYEVMHIVKPILYAPMVQHFRNLKDNNNAIWMYVSTDFAYAQTWRPRWRLPRHPHRSGFIALSRSCFPTVSKSIVDRRGRICRASTCDSSATRRLLWPPATHVSSPPVRLRRPLLLQTSGEVDVSSCKISTSSSLPLCKIDHRASTYFSDRNKVSFCKISPSSPSSPTMFVR